MCLCGYSGCSSCEYDAYMGTQAAADAYMGIQTIAYVSMLLIWVLRLLLMTGKPAYMVQREKRRLAGKPRA